MKAESGPVTKTYTEETTAEDFLFVMQGDTHEEKLDSLIRNVPAKRIMLAIALGRCPPEQVVPLTGFDEIQFL